MKGVTMHKMLVLLMVAGAVIGCQRVPPSPTAEVVIGSAASVPADPADPAWRSAPEYVAKLLLQDMVEPRQLLPTTTEVRVRAMSDGRTVAFRLQWPDTTHDDRAVDNQFADAAAIQLPSQIEPNVPAPQMGELGRRVEISYWNAGWQAVVDGRGDWLANMFPNASIDHYPFEAPALAKNPDAQRATAMRYAPALALGNPVAGPRTAPVEDLIAEGPGTLTAAPKSVSTGSGRRTSTGWEVVLARPHPAGLTGHVRGQVAFAVWDGLHQEVGARKMRTGWIPLVMQAKQ
jgi:hypothetical protein